MKTYDVEVTGVVPLLHGRKDPRKGPIPRSGPERDKWYHDQWMYTHYADKQRRLGQPIQIIKAVCVRGLRETAKAGDVQAGKGKTEQMARACLRIEPLFPLFNSGGRVVEETLPFLDPAEAMTLLSEEEPKVFVIERLCSRGVEITNLGVNGWVLPFRLIDNSDGYFNDEWLERGLEHGFSLIGMGTWRPDFGRGEITKFNLVEG